MKELIELSDGTGRCGLAHVGSCWLYISPWTCRGFFGFFTTSLAAHGGEPEGTLAHAGTPDKTLIAERS